MNAITIPIYDSTERKRLVSIVGILSLLRDAGDLVSSVVDVEAVGPNSAQLHSYGDKQATIPTAQLIATMSKIDQVIDGVFRGFRSLTAQPAVTLEVIDGEAIDVYTENEEFLKAVRQSFPAASEIPN